MRLINVHTLELESFIDELSAPSYAILSHTWGQKEVQYLDLINYRPGEDEKRLDWRKIHLTCDQAKIDGLKYAWIDTCCIDKSSSAELFEAINSMFKWYQQSTVCYVFMPDVHIHTSEGDQQEDQTSASNETSQDRNEQATADTIRPSTYEPKNRSSQTRFLSSFRASRWWTRGWTLQELLAPKKLVFYDVDWDVIGERPTPTKPTGPHPDLMADITSITKIPSEVLTHDTPLSATGIAVKMSWASKRTTTRKEDIAYCLLGIFDINMPLLYGEGDKAFRRLQEEIIRTSADQSIFAWSGDWNGDWNGDQGVILAPSPAYFARSAMIVPRKRDSRDRPADGEAYQLNHKGLSITLPVWSAWNSDEAQKKGFFFHGHYAVLDCTNLEKPGYYVCLDLDVNFIKKDHDLDEVMECVLRAGHKIIYIRESTVPGLVKFGDLRTRKMIVRPHTSYASVYEILGQSGRLMVQLLLPSDDEASVDLQPPSIWNNETTFLGPAAPEQIRTIHIICRNKAGCATIMLWYNGRLTFFAPFGFHLERCPRSGCLMENGEKHGRKLEEIDSISKHRHLVDLPKNGLNRHVRLSWRSAVVVSLKEGPVGEHSSGLRIQVEAENVLKWARWRLGVIAKRIKRAMHPDRRDV